MALHAEGAISGHFHAAITRGPNVCTVHPCETALELSDLPWRINSGARSLWGRTWVFPLMKRVKLLGS